VANALLRGAARRATAKPPTEASPRSQMVRTRVRKSLHISAKSHTATWPRFMMNAASTAKRLVRPPVVSPAPPASRVSTFWISTWQR
jgi:hypothetical protein